MMDGEVAKLAAIVSSTAGALTVYGFIIRGMFKRQNRDHDCIIRLKKDTEYIIGRVDALVDAFNSMNGKKVI